MNSIGISPRVPQARAAPRRTETPRRAHGTRHSSPPPPAQHGLRVERNAPQPGYDFR
eukprot:CAMPEP_0174903942 /NCGR_PEP_ID=MMETSP0167-20121228/46272_1 /TAXON_ID=38298 /ORGANISM="Rhodella maculata, Strain CCMP736" /LENGTH=56 /DNA_ID=CAMNT_0016146417 /DNA_START=110 /DNA_END=277 /DNA_ORIENTATION=+